MKILLTGSNGFVGSNLLKYLDSKKYDIVKVTRHEKAGCLNVGDINEPNKIMYFTNYNF